LEGSLITRVKLSNPKDLEHEFGANRSAGGSGADYWLCEDERKPEVFMNSRLLNKALVAVAMLVGMGQINCGPSSDPIPEAETKCGKGAYRHKSTSGKSVSQRTNVEGPIGTVEAALSDEGEGTVYEPGVHRRSQFVQIRLYQDDRIMATGTGIIVGRNSILTAAHTFYSRNYNRPMLLFNRTPGQTDLVEVPITDHFIHPTYRRLAEANQEEHGDNATVDGLPWRNDFAMVQVAIDFQALGIEPVFVAVDYVPNRDCHECPRDANTLIGWGGYGTGISEHNLHEVSTHALSSNAYIQRTGMLAYNPYFQQGDSGGAVLRYNAELHREELVGIILGRDPEASAYYQIDPDGGALGTTTVGVATTINQQMLNRVINQAGIFRDRNTGLLGPQFPVPNRELPNGNPNPSYTSYPETGPGGPSIPTQSDLGTGVSGYFVGSWPMPEPTIVPQPPAADGCG
jgi:hypothetical protein